MNKRRSCVYHQTVDGHKIAVLVSVVNGIERDVPFQIKGQGWVSVMVYVSKYKQ
jgi:hypothetical protein